MEHLELLSHDFIRITPDRLSNVRNFSTLMAAIINFFILAFYRYDYIEREDGSFSLKPVIDDFPNLMVTYFGYIQLASSWILLIGFCINKISIILKQGWRDKCEKNKQLMSHDLKYIMEPLKPNYQDYNIKELPLYAIRNLLLTEGPEYPAFHVDGKRNFQYAAVEFEYRWICLTFLMKDGDFIFNLVYMLFSLQGLIQSPVFYSCHLGDVINRFPEL
jgi:hypothetical protein